MDDSLIGELEALFENEDSTFEEWQYAYRRTVYVLGLEILTRFPQMVVGPPPLPAGGKSRSKSEKKAVGHGATVSQSHGKGTGPGGYPSVICKFGCLVSELDPGPPPEEK